MWPVDCVLSLWRKMVIPTYKLWLHGLWTICASLSREPVLFKRGHLTHSLTHSLQHWNRNFVILTQFMSLAELEMTTSSAGTDENFDQNYVISIPMSADNNHKRRNTNNRAPGICDVTARAINLYSFLLYRGHFSLESFPWKQPTVGQ